MPRRLSRYESFLAILAGIVFLGMARQELSGRGIDAKTTGALGSTSSVSETMHSVFGACLGLLAALAIATGVAGLLTKWPH